MLPCMEANYRNSISPPCPAVDETLLYTERTRHIFRRDHPDFHSIKYTLFYSIIYQYHPNYFTVENFH